MIDNILHTIYSIESYLQFSGFLALYIGISGALISLIILLLQNFTLSHQLDKFILNKDYFNDYELNIYTSFPLSIIKVIAYQAGIVFPGIMKKRFNQFEIRKHTDPINIMLSYICIFFLILSPITFVNLVTTFFITN